MMTHVQAGAGVVAVIGATGGIGSALSRRLAAAQNPICLVGRDEARLASLAGELGGDFLSTDATDPAQVKACFEQMRQRHERCAAVVHCVGSILLKPAHTTSDEDWSTTLALNLSSAFYVLREAVGWMREGGGSIVLMSSVAARRGLPNHEAIAAAKAGIMGLTLSSAATYARHGIRVNCVAPGLVRTPLSRSLTSNEVIARKSAAMHPLGRIGEPDDIASMVAWLVHPEQSWVTGQVFSVDGGLSSIQSPSNS